VRAFNVVYTSLLFDVCQVLDVLCSLCVGNGVAVRSNQNLIMNNLMPGRDLLLQTNVVDYVYRLFVSVVVNRIQSQCSN